MYYGDEQALKIHSLQLRFMLMLIVHLTNQDNPPKGDQDGI